MNVNIGRRPVRHRLTGRGLSIQVPERANELESTMRRKRYLLLRILVIT